jgi:phospholipid/cholesterol/gamma-HCH transport system substrate-binding protein
MSTSDNKRAVVVGIFVFLAIIIFVAGVFVLGGQQKRFEKTFRVSAVFDNVGGLKVGSNVWFSGVKIGTVRQIQFAGTSQVAITMNLEEDVRKYIHKDALARLSSESLIGNKIVEIYGGSPQAPAVESGDRLGTAVALSTDDIMATLQENNKNLVSITGDFKTLTSKLVKGDGMAGALLSDTTLTQNFRSVLASLQQASQNSARVSRDLARLSGKFNTEGGLANELLTDTTVFIGLKSSVQQLQHTSASAAQLTDNLKETTSKLNENNNAFGMLLNDQQFAGQLKNTMGNLETSSEKLDENMEALQHNFLFRRYFRKKDRQKGANEAVGNRLPQQGDSTSVSQPLNK